MATSPRANRGPSAAPENRAALIGAARMIFATRGLDAPLSAVAKEAGVGQGSLYRHFPTRYSLALAVFEENADELEAIAAVDGSTLDDLLRGITAQAIVSTAFFEMIEIEKADDAGRHLIDRISSVVASKLPEARAAGTLAEWITVDDVLLGIAMLAGALAKTVQADRHAVATRVWTLLPFGAGLAPAPPRMR
jgi:AcrR family transcriptional regulator